MLCPAELRRHSRASSCSAILFLLLFCCQGAVGLLAVLKRKPGSFRRSRLLDPGSVFFFPIQRKWFLLLELIRLVYVSRRIQESGRIRRTVVSRYLFWRHMGRHHGRMAFVRTSLWMSILANIVCLSLPTDNRGGRNRPVSYLTHRSRGRQGTRHRHEYSLAHRIDLSIRDSSSPYFLHILYIGFSENLQTEGEISCTMQPTCENHLTNRSVNICRRIREEHSYPYYSSLLSRSPLALPSQHHRLTHRCHL